MFNSVTYNSLISYECNYGYMIIGESVRRCERSQEWTGLQPICRGKLRLTVVTFVEQFHRILSNWNSELKVVTTGDNELVSEI